MKNKFQLAIVASFLFVMTSPVFSAPHEGKQSPTERQKEIKLASELSFEIPNTWTEKSIAPFPAPWLAGRAFEFPTVSNSSAKIERGQVLVAVRAKTQGANAKVWSETVESADRKPGKATVSKSIDSNHWITVLQSDHSVKPPIIGIIRYGSGEKEMVMVAISFPVSEMKSESTEKSVKEIDEVFASLKMNESNVYTNHLHTDSGAVKLFADIGILYDTKKSTEEATYYRPK